MERKEMIAVIDHEIARLQEARYLLAGGETFTEEAPKKRKFSPEAIERMRAGQKRRWAKAKKGGEVSRP